MVPESAIKQPQSRSLPDQGIQETPIKKGTTTTTTHSHPRMAGSGNEKENVKEPCVQRASPAAVVSQEDSIYKSLGWDDTDDIDELASGRLSV